MLAVGWPDLLTHTLLWAVSCVKPCYAIGPVFVLQISTFSQIYLSFDNINAIDIAIEVKV